MRILITGGAGFIGSNLADLLFSLGLDIAIVDDLSTGKKQNIEHLKNIKFIHGDLLDKDVRQEAFKDVRTVFHLASPISVTESIKNPENMFKKGLLGTALIIEEAIKNKIDRIIFSSTAAVYPDGDTPKNEDSAAYPFSPYSSVKAACEMIGMSMAKCYEPDFVSLRYFNVYGPRQDPSSPYSGVISRLCSHSTNKTCFTVYGTGEQTRDFVFVGDVAQANVLAMKAHKRFNGMQINIGTGIGTSINELILNLTDINKQEFPIKYEPFRKGECLHSVANINRAKELLSYIPQTKAIDGLRLTLDWHREQILKDKT